VAESIFKYIIVLFIYVFAFKRDRTAYAWRMVAQMVACSPTSLLPLQSAQSCIGKSEQNHGSLRTLFKGNQKGISVF
jgi:hypothetical protein